MKKIILVVSMVIVLGILCAAPVCAEATKVTLDPDVYTDITTDSVWEKMNIQVFKENATDNVIIKDGLEYHKYDCPRFYTDLIEVCDIDGDGENELIFTTNANTSGMIYEYFWCYSKTKEIKCAFGLNISVVKKSEATIIKNDDGTYSLSVLGNADGKLAIENIDGEYWLTVTYPEYGESAPDFPNPASVEQIGKNRKMDGWTTPYLMETPPAEYEPSMSIDEKYNISYYEEMYYISESTEGKITSYDELEAIFPNNGFILSMYDEAFFEDKFLYRIGYDAPDPSYDVKVSSVMESQDSVSIEVTVTDNEAIVPDVEVPWVIFLEFDRSYLDKEITSNLKSRDLEGLAKISYYGRMEIIDSRFHGREESEPHRRKVIKSVAELEKFIASMPRNPIPDAKFNNVISAYDEEFFKDNFLVFVAWMYPMGGTIDYSISEVRDDNGVVNITTLETNLTPPGHMTTQAEENWTILYEIDAAALENGYSLTMKTSGDKEVDIITYIPSQFRTVTPETVHNNAFGEVGTVLAEISLGADNAQKTVMVGSTELYYSVERDKHVGVVDAQYVVDNKITSVSVIDKAPVVVTYGDVNDFSYEGTVTNGDLHQLKLYMQGASSLYDKALIMADVTGDGQINNGDILQLKLFLAKDRPFSVLSK